MRVMGVAIAHVLISKYNMMNNTIEGKGTLP
jgi:hypothetical protein